MATIDTLRADWREIVGQARSGAREDLAKASISHANSVAAHGTATWYAEAVNHYRAGCSLAQQNVALDRAYRERIA